jgi:hypothetical protein
VGGVINMENGKWKMEDGKWKMENGKCPANGMRLWRRKNK